MYYLVLVTYILFGSGIDRTESCSKEYRYNTKNVKNINSFELKYFPYLNGYRKVEARKQDNPITWLDIFKTYIFLAKTNILILSYNLKALIQHSHHLNFGFYLPSDLETFIELTKTLRKTRGF